MRSILSIILLLTSFVVCKAQTDTAQVKVRPDSVIASSIDSLSAEDPEEIDNSSTVDLILQAKTEDQTSLIKEDLLTEQLESLRSTDVIQRRLIERQLAQLREADSLRKVEQRRQIDSLKKTAVGAPVMLNNDTIYLLYTNLLSVTPSERAALSSQKILKVAKMYSMNSDSLSIIDGGATSDIMYRDIVLGTVTDADALWVDMPRHTLAEQRVKDIETAIGIYKKNVSLLNILKMVGLSLLVLIIQFGLIKGVSHFFKKIVNKRLKANREKWFTGLRIRSFVIMDSKRQLGAALFLSKMLRYFLYIILLYLTLPLLFSIFPATQRLAEILFGWIFTPLAALFRNFMQYLPNLFRIIIIIVIFHYIIKFFRYISHEIGSGKLVIPGFYQDWAKATFNILRIFLYAFMVILIFPFLPGSDSGVFQGVSVFIGVIFTLGSTNVIGNLMAGMVITYMRPFVIGDRIRIGDMSGDVIEKSPFVVRVKTIRNEIITVPNSTVLSSNVVNYSSTTAQNEGLILNTTVTVGYDIPWREVNQLLIDAALKTDLILKKPQPFVLQAALNDNAASYQLCAYTEHPEKQAVIYSNLHQNIRDSFSNAGIDMTTPIYQVNRQEDIHKATSADEGAKKS